MPFAGLAWTHGAMYQIGYGRHMANMTEWYVLDAVVQAVAANIVAISCFVIV